MHVQNQTTNVLERLELGCFVKAVGKFPQFLFDLILVGPFFIYYLVN